MIKFWLHELRDYPINLLHEHHLCLLNNLSKIKINLSLSSGVAGGLGFGTGFCLLIILRWLSDPDNNLSFQNFGLCLLRETIFFSLITVLGWSFLGRSIFSRHNKNIMLPASLFLGALGGLIATQFVHTSLNLLSQQFKTTPYLGILIQFEGALIYGAFIGAAFGLLEGYHHRLLFMSFIGAFSFGFSHLLLELVFHLLYLLPYANYWKSGPWFIPLAIACAIHGLCGGAILGWVVGREKPTRPTKLSVLVISAKNQSAF